MEYIAATFAFIAVVAIAHALDVRARNKELFAQCVALTKANGALMTQRDEMRRLMAGVTEGWEWPEEIDVEARRAA